MPTSAQGGSCPRLLTLQNKKTFYVSYAVAFLASSCNQSMKTCMGSGFRFGQDEAKGLRDCFSLRHGGIKSAFGKNERLHAPGRMHGNVPSACNRDKRGIRHRTAIPPATLAIA
ncbi:hypothetical protein NK553_26620 [Pseudomonas sp. ZM23]|uniref:Uncharacterized protein n=1 Tax=Pseudomonas triclosanedens TaxID=2961893 RepID=A0ABY6ZSZ8_9PSED|nr:hypothetical protein [Pseudomonas triclosanedens]MCP8467532.1 hypothetical protein [Pseudomonas triclosanedens]MCP8471709.1 hypothetical protein [Pseudomonas triclosanedens]MCP8478938.1 hypothetical protein [Pseudomonas triclosanedens]WAI47004.1 hypothetical protein OU419_14565 [Pseudomonas triclosanedens]